jgi:hypothetical protein
MTLSLAFLAPHIVKTAIEGGLPCGYGFEGSRCSDVVTRPMANARTRAVGLRMKIDQRIDRLSSRRRTTNQSVIMVIPSDAKAMRMFN